MNGQHAPDKTKCAHCGALLEIGDATPFLVCEYCGCPMEAGPAGGGKPDKIAPCKLTETRARVIAGQWLTRDHEDVVPNFAKQARITALEGAYWPFYHFSGVYSGWCHNRGSISGGFSELQLASGELLNLRMIAPAYRFFTPPREDVSLEDLSKRVMIELFDEMRAVAHVDFCQSVLQYRIPSPLTDYTEDHSSQLPLKPFTEYFETAEKRLKEMLSGRAHLQDIYFPQLSVKRIYWPFWRAEYAHGEDKYFLMIDGSSSDGVYRGGYKPVVPGKEKLDFSKFVDSDPEEILRFFNTTSDDSPLSRSVRKTKSLITVESNLESKCFIATAAYGSPLAEDVVLLRRFRDDILMKYYWGRWFVNGYYRVSPRIATVIASSELLKSMVRGLLKSFIQFYRKTS